MPQFAADFEITSFLSQPAGISAPPLQTHYQPPASIEQMAAARKWSDVHKSRQGGTEEYAARHQALLNLIAARTGLTPRKFDTDRQGRGNR